MTTLGDASPPEAAAPQAEAAEPEADGSAREAPAVPPLPRRMVDVFLSPGALFAALREEPRWAGAVIVGAVMLMGSTAAIPVEMWGELIRQSMLESGRPMPEGFDPAAFGTLQKTFGVVGNGVFWFLAAFLLAVISSFVFSFLLGDEGRYRQHLSVVAHALLITAAGALLTTPLRIVQGDLQASLNLGLFFPLDEGFAARFLRGLDLFWLWTFIVIAVGVHELDRRRSVGSAAVILLLVPLVMSALFAWFSPV